MSQTIEQQVKDIFRDFFDDTDLDIGPETTAADVEGWDSLTHIDLIVAIEKAFKIRFTTAEVTGMNDVGDLINLVIKKQG